MKLLPTFALLQSLATATSGAARARLLTSAGSEERQEQQQRFHDFTSTSSA